MKHIAYIALFFAALFVITGCSKSPEKKFANYMEEWADIIIDNQNNCDKMGEKLSKFVDKNGEEMGKLMVEIAKAQEKDGKSEKLENLLPEKKLKAIDDNKCKDNSAVQGAMMKFGLIMMGGALSAATNQ